MHLNSEILNTIFNMQIPMLIMNISDIFLIDMNWYFLNDKL